MKHDCDQDGPFDVYAASAELLCYEKYVEKHNELIESNPNCNSPGWDEGFVERVRIAAEQWFIDNSSRSKRCNWRRVARIDASPVLRRMAEAEVSDDEPVIKSRPALPQSAVEAPEHEEDKEDEANADAQGAAAPAAPVVEPGEPYRNESGPLLPLDVALLAWGFHPDELIPVCTH